MFALMLECLGAGLDEEHYSVLYEKRHSNKSLSPFEKKRISPPLKWSWPVKSGKEDWKHWAWGIANLALIAWQEDCVSHVWHDI